eukprot:4669730-Lingulodinium_polyedra.AAC.1
MQGKNTAAVALNGNLYGPNDNLYNPNEYGGVPLYTGHHRFRSKRGGFRTYGNPSGAFELRVVSQGPHACSNRGTQGK